MASGRCNRLDLAVDALIADRTRHWPADDGRRHLDVVGAPAAGGETAKHHRCGERADPHAAELTSSFGGREKGAAELRAELLPGFEALVQLVCELGERPG